MRLGIALAAALGLASCTTETKPAEEPIEASQSPKSPAMGVGVQDDHTGASARVHVACTGDEEVIFSCTVESGEQLAVCAADNGTVQYRYGDGDAELVLDDGSWARAAYSGGGEAQIRFSNTDTDYIVFSRMVRTNFAAGEPNYPAISDGVIVLRGEDVVALKTCGDAQGLPVQYDAAERHLPLIDELFTYETGRADPH